MIRHVCFVTWCFVTLCHDVCCIVMEQFCKQVTLRTCASAAQRQPIWLCSGCGVGKAFYHIGKGKAERKGRAGHRKRPQGAHHCRRNFCWPYQMSAGNLVQTCRRRARSARQTGPTAECPPQKGKCVVVGGPHDLMRRPEPKRKVLETDRQRQTDRQTDK